MRDKGKFQTIRLAKQEAASRARELLQLPKLHPNPLLSRFLDWVLTIKRHRKTALSIDSPSSVESLSKLLAILQLDYQVSDPCGELQKLKQKKTLVVANHPLGARDGLSLLSMLSKYGRVKSPVNEVLLGIKPLKDFFIPISVYKNKRFQVFHQLNKEVSHADILLYFPAGACSKLQNQRSLASELKASHVWQNRVAHSSEWKAWQGHFERASSSWQSLRGIYDETWQRSFLHMARENKLDILPLHISGKNSLLFHGISVLRRVFRIKLSLEMFTLNHEFLYGPRHLQITIGKRIPFEQIQSWPESLDYCFSQLVKHSVYQVSKTADPSTIWNIFYNVRNSANCAQADKVEAAAKAADRAPSMEEDDRFANHG